MLLDDVWTLFEETVFPVCSTGTLFNQYNDKLDDIDSPDADRVRRENLMNYLCSFSKRPYIVFVGEAPGWRGCRFSGVPFTSETQLCSGVLPFAGYQSSNVNSPYSEPTAKVFWETMRTHHPRFFAWNCVPFHPHEPGKMLSNRTPTNAEIDSCSILLSGLLSLIKPERIVAVGKKAEVALRQVGIDPIYVRHPAHGGTKDFGMGVGRFFAGVQ